MTFACDINAKVVIGGFSAGLNTGFSIGGFEEVTTSKTTSFSGAVAGIPAEFYAENKYSWCMYIYRQKLKDDAGAVMQDFFVVNYWVE